MRPRGQVRGGDLRAISTDGLHTLAAMSDGSVLSSGYNGYGEIGDGTYTERLTAVPVLNLTGVVQVVAATRFSLALKSDGTVWSWGANSTASSATASVTASNRPLR